MFPCTYVSSKGKKREPSSSSVTAINGVVTSGSSTGLTQADTLVQNGVAVPGSSRAYLENKAVHETKALAAELCRHFYTLGWVSGTGGSISIKVHDDSLPISHQLIVMSPSGTVVSPLSHLCVPKERMVAEDMYVFSSDGIILSTPSFKPYPHRHPKCTDCAPIFMKAECYHYLFDAAIKLHKLGLDWSSPSHGPIHNVNGVWGCGMDFNRGLKAGPLSFDYMIEPSQRCIVLDIAGTTTSRPFVSNILFAYAHDNVGKHLAATYDTAETQDDLNLLRSQIQNDLDQGIVGAVPIPPDCVGKELVIASLVANVESMIRADRKAHIWRTGFQCNELVGAVFDDVPEALERWQAAGIKVYMYSSGSREAQQLLFANSNYGDLRKYFCGFFDTTLRNKDETHSYIEIMRTVGVDRPADMLFVTDVFQDAAAARAAGLEVVIPNRPGNEPLPEHHGFRMIESLLEI
ncbi:hypothetical protein LWI29_010388 [Acer saccharum]|uniref:Class II aldolase/adducin N-terminal domain-containing protein n=1 Tax=Acer saccharum TaxID=4024 RepID=A0AA39VSR6_ACESA|nr:hypothetical protein LWI29_010388 [Acer saccharum]